MDRSAYLNFDRESSGLGSAGRKRGNTKTLALSSNENGRIQDAEALSKYVRDHRNMVRAEATKTVQFAKVYSAAGLKVMDSFWSSPYTTSNHHLRNRSEHEFIWGHALDC
jgi:hypothetical protein